MEKPLKWRRGNEFLSFFFSRKKPMFNFTNSTVSIYTNSTQQPKQPKQKPSNPNQNNPNKTKPNNPKQNQRLCYLCNSPNHIKFQCPLKKQPPKATYLAAAKYVSFPPKPRAAPPKQFLPNREKPLPRTPQTPNVAPNPRRNQAPTCLPRSEPPPATMWADATSDNEDAMDISSPLLALG